MCQCMLCTTKYKDELLDKFEELEGDSELLKTIAMTQEGNVFKLKYSGLDCETEVIESFAHVAGDIIQRQGIIKLTNDYLIQRKDLSQTDKLEIEKRFIANNYLTKQEGFSALTYYLVYMPVLEDLKQTHELNIDGWLRFRMCKYRLVLEDILEQFIEEYLIKGDILKFIKLIREINYLNVPLEDTLHLVYAQNGRIRILNEAMEEVTIAYIHKYCKEFLADQSISHEDLIMNILITVSPRKIMIHLKERSKHPEFLNTLESIFERNISYCEGCKYCTDNTITIKL